MSEGGHSGHFQARSITPRLLRRMTLVPLACATYFMVAGGPYGLEEIVGYAGYRIALLLLILLPLVWSLPTALMVGELASALPDEGGFYVWVTRALGPFWGFQEGWLSLSASIFDMALYPTLFTAYLGQLAPAAVAGHRGLALEVGVIALCVAWNLRGAHGVGEGARWLCWIMLAPFGVLVVFALWRAIHLHTGATAAAPSHVGSGLAGAVLVALWNTMGWDNASTVAQEVDQPQRTYPRAMLAAVALVVLSYVVPIAAVAAAHIPAAQFANGAWVLAGRELAGGWLAVILTIGGALTGIAMFNALTMSYSRLPLVMAQDGWLPRVLARRNARGVPWVATLVMAVLWCASLALDFDRLIVMDITLYGASLVLEFVALAVLRVREPGLPRPFRVPGGMPGAVLLGLPVLFLLLYAGWNSRNEAMFSRPALEWCAMIAALGPVLFAIAWLAKRLKAHR